MAPEDDLSKDAEFASLGYIDWFNHRRLHGEITKKRTCMSPLQPPISHRFTQEAIPRRSDHQQ